MTNKIKTEDQITLIPIDQLHSSPVNARKNFNPDEIAELSKSIAENGLIQPITIRLVTTITNPDKSIWWEIVTGERRFRACKIAAQVKPELREVKCIVREYTDEEVEAIQLAENIHRKDLSPMEECNAYRKLLKYHKTIQRVSEVVGKSENYVSSRMQLISLEKKLQKCLDEGSLPVAQALIIAKLPEEEQKELQNHDVLNFDNKGNLQQISSVKELKEVIADRIYIPINSASFDLKDKSLNPKMGSCLDCKFNTGCNTVLFSDITDESFCTKGSCFQEKTFKHITARVKELKKAGENVTLLYEEDYVYGDHKKKVNNLEATASCDFSISEKKKDGCIGVGIFIEKERYQPKHQIGEEVYLSEKPKEKKNSSPSSRNKDIPADETPIEMRERRMKERFVKEDNLDKIEVRKLIVKDIIETQKSISPTIIKKAVKTILFNLKYNNLLIFRYYGIDIKGTESLETDNLDAWKVDDKDLKKLLDQIKTESDLLQLIKCSIAYYSLDLYMKNDVNITKTQDDRLIQIAKEYSINIPNLHAPLVHKRQTERTQEFADLNEAKKRVAEREKKNVKEVKPKSKKTVKK
jgi:ParB/RepB/Spo0J family partition protein